MLYAALLAHPLPHRQRHLTCDVSTGGAPFGGGIEGIQFNERAPIPLGLVPKLPQDLAPTRIPDGAGEAAVLHHVLDAERFHTDHVIPAYQIGRELVCE